MTVQVTFACESDHIHEVMEVIDEVTEDEFVEMALEDFQTQHPDLVLEYLEYATQTIEQG